MRFAGAPWEPLSLAILLPPLAAFPSFSLSTPVPASEPYLPAAPRTWLTPVWVLLKVGKAEQPLPCDSASRSNGREARVMVVVLGAVRAQGARTTLGTFPVRESRVQRSVSSGPGAGAQTQSVSFPGCVDPRQATSSLRGPISSLRGPIASSVKWAQ